jgi:hypothetical protein
MQRRASLFGWRIAARLDAGLALNTADAGPGPRGGGGGLAKRGRADGLIPEAGPRVAEAGWHTPAEIGPAGREHNVEGGARLTDVVPHERDGKILLSRDRARHA